MVRSVNVFLVFTTVCTVLCSNSATQTGLPDSQQQGHIHQLMESLDQGSVWYNMMRNGARGDGVHYPWMDDLRKAGIRLAVFTFEFTWHKKGKKIDNWSLVRETYFRDYDRSQEVSRPVLDEITDAGLKQRMENIALSRAKGGSWLEYPANENGTGYRTIYLADDEWLPVTLSSFFQRYDPGTTSLMHAALLGDLGRIMKEVQRGADVNARSNNGSTALVYAACSDSPDVLEYLLNFVEPGDTNRKQIDAALVAAVETNRAANVDLLLKAGANPGSVDNEGIPILSIAKRNNYSDIVHLLSQSLNR